MQNRKAFFDLVRRDLFSGSLSEEQVAGMEMILDYRDRKWPVVIDDQLAYILATVFHETGKAMQPVTEAGSAAYLRSRPYWPWIGRGLIQLTWVSNYRRFGLKKPEDALSWPVALDICFRGMIGGIFTGAKLSDFIRPGGVDYIHARKIINGMDRALLIANYAVAFQAALMKARS